MPVSPLGRGRLPPEPPPASIPPRAGRNSCVIYGTIVARLGVRDSRGRMFDAVRAGLKRAVACVDAAPIARGPLTVLVVSLLAVVLQATARPTHANADASYAAEPLVAAQSARAFGDSVGVNVRLAWIDTSYGNFSVIESRLRELGVRYLRDGLCATCEYQIDRLNRLAAVGIK